nr:MAG TPA: hypothetical protein [Crassvirales sp.]
MLKMLPTKCYIFIYAKNMKLMSNLKNYLTNYKLNIERN